MCIFVRPCCGLKDLASTGTSPASVDCQFSFAYARTIWYVRSYFSCSHAVKPSRFLENSTVSSTRTAPNNCRLLSCPFCIFTRYDHLHFCRIGHCGAPLCRGNCWHKSRLRQCHCQQTWFKTPSHSEIAMLKYHPSNRLVALVTHADDLLQQITINHGQHPHLTLKPTTHDSQTMAKKERTDEILANRE